MFCVVTIVYFDCLSTKRCRVAYAMAEKMSFCAIIASSGSQTYWYLWLCLQMHNTRTPFGGFAWQWFISRVAHSPSTHAYTKYLDFNKYLHSIPPMIRYNGETQRRFLFHGAWNDLWSPLGMRRKHSIWVHISILRNCLVSTKNFFIFSNSFFNSLRLNVHKDCVVLWLSCLVHSIVFCRIERKIPKWFSSCAATQQYNSDVLTHS